MDMYTKRMCQHYLDGNCENCDGYYENCHYMECYEDGDTLEPDFMDIAHAKMEDKKLKKDLR